jgi:hypothetical protein
MTPAQDLSSQRLIRLTVLDFGLFDVGPGKRLIGILDLTRPMPARRRRPPRAMGLRVSGFWWDLGPRRPPQGSWPSWA